ncbi:hypothetical protein [Tindallia californiensis]|uniref:NfeD-like C-terminal, partner-binding n=1 Tax=Tindallia californiensis TaxID=159292 RepID=A0A1H3QCA2_9FIRM|nr:hypothetical protein [Tindallia californiensis]SDZ11164.1 hypothetical protein SAMN05192546_1096 [Tindallia californiensis]
MIDSFSETLILDRIYWYLAIPFTVLLVIQLIATFAGLGGEMDFEIGDSDIDIDIDITEEGDSKSGLQYFTVRNFIAFFAVFGWSGITFSHAGLGQFTTILLSTVLGTAILLIVSGLFYSISKLAHNGTMNIQKAKGATGEVYLPIPPGKKGVGKVSITFQDSLRELDAMTDEEEIIPRGTMVVVTDIVSSSVLLVEKLNRRND